MSQATTAANSGLKVKHRSVGAIATASRPADPVAVRRSKFERLTAGVLDGIQPPQPARLEPGPIR